MKPIAPALVFVASIRFMNSNIAHPVPIRRGEKIAKVAREMVERAGVDVNHLIDLLVKKCCRWTHDILLPYDTAGQPH
jgi:hypothetical protein